MSATVFYFPKSYVTLLPVLRRRLSAGSVSSSNIKLGVSTNFDKLCGCVLQVAPSCCNVCFVGSHTAVLMLSGAIPMHFHTSCCD